MTTEKYAFLSRLLNNSRLTRRQFLTRAGVAGMALGLPPALTGCGGSSDSARTMEERTLFFNLSHLGSAPDTHVLHIAGKRFPLTPVADAPHVLARASQTNAFLNDANVARQITHHVESMSLPADAVMLAYLTSMEDPDKGTWQMNMIHLVLPTQAHQRAYATISAGATGAFPHSAKRMRYGLPAASSARELMEESMLVDVSDHAQTLIGMHAELASLDPDTAAHVHGSYIAPSPDAVRLAYRLADLGPATVQQAAGQANQNGWATLVPMMNNRVQPPAPFKKGDGRLNLYRPDWNSQVDMDVAYALRAIKPLVANDAALGMDVTSVTKGQPLQPEKIKGKLWSWHEGEAYRERRPVTASEAAPALTINSIATETGLAVGQPTVTNEGGTVKVTLDNVNNWYLRWLGVWLQFRSGDGNKLIPIADLPPDTLQGRTGPSPMDRPYAMFAGMMPPVSVLAGIPIDPGSFAPTIRIPSSAASTEVLYGGLGLSGLKAGIVSDADLAELVRPGVVMTVLVNYVLVTLFMGLGATPTGALISEIAELVAEGLVIVLIDLITGVDLNNASPGEIIQAIVTELALMICTKGVNELIDKLIEKVAPAASAQEVADSIPVVGMIARAVADALDFLEIVETTAEIAVSPPVYSFSMVLTRNVTVTLLPDATSKAFPTKEDNQTFYYKLSYQFDSGPSHVLTAVDLPSIGKGATSLAIPLDGIPLGGKVNVAIAIYVRNASTPVGQSDWCAAQASSGLQPNDASLAPVLTLTNNKIPINAGTTYLHRRRTVLAADGTHRWQNDGNAPPYLPPPGDQQPGLGALRNITVREMTVRNEGYVGYAWQAFSSGVPGCGTDQGQYDYLANLNTDSASAQQGYASSPCGLQSGAQLSYSLLSDDNLNLYLDPGQLYLRPVQLGSSPSFAGTRLAFGQLNAAPAALLLHPAGHVVSINQEHHILETLRLPSAAVDEATAAVHHRARVHSGLGSRPGLMNKPVAAVVSGDGIILVLEASDTNNRIQAFDLGGNPVPYFKGQAEPWFLRLKATAGAIYLDIAVEFGGYIYVLSRDDGGLHRLDIYASQQQGTDPVCTTFNFNAAAIAVDYARTLYALNYQPLTLLGGSLPALTEPSISQWSPPLP
ncbi:twin-arginine translocation signal domain-containing protein [Noviherbaspirillum sp. 1P10PC]|uniref:twin-arginine translocation signal domain-containing protein n=1 Tax=Noviherbaspirillum sp. 1P10PC TaxID=3132292 RepID=UPI0039A17F71